MLEWTGLVDGFLGRIGKYFTSTTQKAIKVYENSGEEVEHHFVSLTKMITSRREVSNQKTSLLKRM